MARGDFTPTGQGWQPFAAVSSTGRGYVDHGAITGGGGEMNIEVFEIKPVRRGSLKAFATVRLGEDLTIFNFRIIQQPGQRAYVHCPQLEYIDGFGARKYFPVVKLSPELKEKVESAILEGWMNY